jgi:hypothetical protein
MNPHVNIELPTLPESQRALRTSEGPLFVLRVFVELVGFQMLVPLESCLAGVAAEGTVFLVLVEFFFVLLKLPLGFEAQLAVRTDEGARVRF